MFCISVLLSKDPRRTLIGLRSAEDFRAAIKDGCYGNGEDGFNLRVRADSHLAAAEVAFAVCNSSVGELHCERVYQDQVKDYRAAGNRSLSVGDICLIRIADGFEAPSQASPEDGRYGCASMGWVLI